MTISGFESIRKPPSLEPGLMRPMFPFFSLGRILATRKDTVLGYT